MTNFITFHTEVWSIALPGDWAEQESDGQSLYFEAGDGSKGLYVTTWNLGSGDGRSASEVAASFRAADLQALHNMEGYAWRVLEESAQGTDSACVTVMDCLALEKSYRTIGKLMVALPMVVRASFHDYACIDYPDSQAYFMPLINSLQFRQPES